MERLRNVFSGVEYDHVVSHLGRLVKHVSPKDFVIVGGLAIRYHLVSNGVDFSKRKFNDLDIIVKSDKVISPSIASDFFIYHYHPNPYFMALVDPKTAIKMDVFSYDPAPKITSNMQIEGMEFQVVSIEDQLVKTVFDTQCISSDRKVDPKQFEDTLLLSEIADLGLADRIWKSHSFVDCPEDIQSAIDMARRKSLNHPEWIQEKPFRRANPYKCKACRNENGFVVEPMEKVYNILGYVE